MNGTLCYVCGAPATHLCKSCGKWLCDSRDCARTAAGAQLSNHPVKTAAFAIAHPIDATRAARHILIGPPAAPTHGGPRNRS